MLKLKFQCFGHLMRRTDLLEDPDLGKIKGRRRWGQQRMRWLGDIIDSIDMNVSTLWEIMRDRDSWCAAVRGVMKSWA